MTKTCVIHDVTPADLNTVLADLKRDGYNTASYQEPDGDYTVIGTKEVPDSAAPPAGGGTAQGT